MNVECRMTAAKRNGVKVALRGAARWVLGFVLLALLAPCEAQGPAKVYRIGYLSINAPDASDRSATNCPVKGGSVFPVIVEGLRERGYVQGRNLVIECRYTGAREELAPDLAKELVALHVDLLVVNTTANVRAAKEATKTIPIVMWGVIDPVRRGLVASLARPGGNVTGIAEDAGTEIAGKWLELLKLAVPRVSRVAVLAYQSLTQEPGIWGQAMEPARSAFKLETLPHPVRQPEQLEPAFGAMAREGANGLLLLPAPFFATQLPRIVDLAARYRLPAVYPARDYAVAGGLLAYDVDLAALRRRIPYYVDRILKGAKPTDLPVERPTTYRLTINLATAKALGLTIPASLLAQADEVIE